MGVYQTKRRVSNINFTSHGGHLLDNEVFI